jgi:hypothetical protein
MPDHSEMVPLAFLLAAAIETLPAAPLDLEAIGQGQTMARAVQILDKEFGSDLTPPELKQPKDRIQQAQWHNWFNCGNASWRNC